MGFSHWLHAFQWNSLSAPTERCFSRHISHLLCTLAARLYQCELAVQPVPFPAVELKGRLQCLCYLALTEHWNFFKVRDYRKGNKETWWEITHFKVNFVFWSFQRELTTTKETKPLKAPPTRAASIIQGVLSTPSCRRKGDPAILREHETWFARLGL